jgi:hypothetical protein
VNVIRQFVSTVASRGFEQETNVGVSAQPAMQIRPVSKLPRSFAWREWNEPPRSFSSAPRSEQDRPEELLQLELRRVARRERRLERVRERVVRRHLGRLLDGPRLFDRALRQRLRRRARRNVRLHVRGLRADREIGRSSDHGVHALLGADDRHERAPLPAAPRFHRYPRAAAKADADRAACAEAECLVPAVRDVAGALAVGSVEVVCHGPVPNLDTGEGVAPVVVMHGCAR